jgi:predicted GNAT superfamily acetyltransferase
VLPMGAPSGMLCAMSPAHRPDRRPDRDAAPHAARLRPVHVDDLADVLALNEAEVEMLAPMDEPRFSELRRLADRFDVVEADSLFAGFVITFSPGSAYDSENYRWFSARHGERFYYLDRFVLRPEHRRRGLGGWVYDDVERTAAAYGRMALEVNLVPRNDPSLAFHAARGYAEVGRLGTEDHLVSLMEKMVP